MGAKSRTPLSTNNAHTYLVAIVLQFVLLILPQQPVLAQVASKQYGATRVDFSVAGVSGFVIEPNHSESVNSKPWIWYAPTFVKATPRTGKYPNKSLTWLFTRLLDKGIWIAGVDIGESYGNLQGRRAYTRFYKYVRKAFALSPRPCLLAQSRGGLMLYNWAAEHAHDARCIAGIYPVTNLESWPGLRDEELQRAYGMSQAELQKHLDKDNPIDRLAPLAQAKVPVFLIHGDADKVVSLQQNTLEFARRYHALGGKAEVEVVHGKGHEEVPEFFESERLLDFLLRFLSPGAPKVCP